MKKREKEIKKTRFYWPTTAAPVVKLQKKTCQSCAIKLSFPPLHKGGRYRPGIGQSCLLTSFWKKHLYVPSAAPVKRGEQITERTGERRMVIKVGFLFPLLCGPRWLEEPLGRAIRLPAGGGTQPLPRRVPSSSGIYMELSIMPQRERERERENSTLWNRRTTAVLEKRERSLEVLAWNPLGFLMEYFNMDLLEAPDMKWLTHFFGCKTINFVKKKKKTVGNDRVHSSLPIHTVSHFSMHARSNRGRCSPKKRSKNKINCWLF